jgi:transcriptional regulator with XRE-family HTH domain
MSDRTSWDDLKTRTPLSAAGRAAYDDEARISAFRELVHRLRTEAGLTQAELAERMGTTQSAIARMEGVAPGPPSKRSRSWLLRSEQNWLWAWASTSRTTAALPSSFGKAVLSCGAPADQRRSRTLATPATSPRPTTSTTVARSSASPASG